MPLPQPDWPLEQLRRHFGGIPGERILLDPPPGTATEEGLIRLNSQRGYPAELLDGVFVDRTPGFQAGVLMTQLLCRLMDHLEEDDQGIVLPGWKCPVRLRPGLIRLTSIYFINWDRIPESVIPNDPIASLIPDLVGDVLSPWSTRGEMERKQQEFFAAGTRLFWLLDLQEESVEVSTPQRTLHLSSADSLSGGDVLPGFVTPVREIFTMPRPRGQ